MATQQLTTDAVISRLSELQEKAGLTSEEQHEQAKLEKQLRTTSAALEQGDALISSEENLAAAEDAGKSQAELQAILGEARESELMQALVNRQAKAERDSERHALQIDTYAWHYNEEGELEMKLLPYRSNARACLAALSAVTNEESRKLLGRTVQLVLNMPTQPLEAHEADLAARFGIPTGYAECLAETEALLERWIAEYDGQAQRPAFKMMPSLTPIADKGSGFSIKKARDAVSEMQLWELQRGAMIKRVEDELEARGLTGVDASVIGSARSATVERGPTGDIKKVYVDRVSGLEATVITGVAEELVGPDGRIDDLSALPYQKLQFSTSAVDTETGRADYRPVYGLERSPEVHDEISQILGHGRFMQDGASYGIAPEEQAEIWTRPFQMRARRDLADITKGLVIPLALSFVKRRLELARRSGLSEELPEGYAALQKMVETAEGGTAAILIASGDMMKYKGEGAGGDGRYWMAGTYLRGKTYEMSFNSQGIQLLSNSAMPKLGGFVKRAIEKKCYWPLMSPEAIARVVDEKIGDIRSRDAELFETGQDGSDEDTELLENLDTLRSVLASGAVRHTTDAQTERLEGGRLPEGGVRIPGQGVERLLDMIWASLVKKTLRSWGIQMTGGLLLTCEDSVSRCRRLWGIEAGADGGGLEATDPQHWIPMRVTDLLNGDNDGDLVAGVAADTKLEDGRIVKLVMLMRYPQVDAPVLWALPAGTPTPWDAPYEEVCDPEAPRSQILETARSYYGRFPQLSAMGLDMVEDPDEIPEGRRPRLRFTGQEIAEKVNAVVNQKRTLYQEFLQVFSARIPEGEDLYSDEPTLCESDLIRIKDAGIKSGLDKEKLSGPVTHRSAMDMCYRKAELRWTGPYTRKHERLAARLHRHNAKAEASSEMVAKGWRRSARELLKRLGASGDAIETQVTGFKYEMAEDVRSPSAFLGQKDRDFGRPEDVGRAIPVDYHGRVDAISTIQERYRDWNSGEEALESLEYFGPVDEDGRPSYRPKASEPTANQRLDWLVPGKETMILNSLQDTVLADITRAFKALQTSLYPYVTELDRRLSRSEELDITSEQVKGEAELPAELQAELDYALDQLDSWRTFWIGHSDDPDDQGCMGRYNQIIESSGASETEEAYKRAADFRSMAARVKKEELREAGRGLSIEALTLAVADHWSEDGEEAYRSDGTSYERRVNATPAVALMGERVSEVFPLKELTVKAELQGKAKTAVFTTQADLASAGLAELPGNPGEQLETSELVWSAKKGMFLARLETGAVLPLRVADGEELPFDPAEGPDPTRKAKRHAVRVAGMRSIVYL